VKSGQVAQHQRRISRGAATLAKMAYSPKSDPARSHARYTKAKAACHPTVKPTTTPSLSVARSWSHGRRRNGTSAGTPTGGRLTLALTFTTAQRRRRRPIRTKPSRGNTPTRHKGADARAGCYHAHARRNSKAGGCRDCSSEGPRKTRTTKEPDKRLKTENGEPRKI